MSKGEVADGHRRHVSEGTELCVGVELTLKELQRRVGRLCRR